MTNLTGFSIISNSLIIAIFAIALFFYFKPALLSSEAVNKSFSQFVSLDGSDEYVVAKLKTNEVFEQTEFNNFLDWPIGHTSVRISLVAHYKYYVKLAELKHHIENGIVFIEAPKLYLSTPVSFEFSTVTEETNKFLFGKDGKEILDQLKKESSDKLIKKGQLQIGVVYEKAAKALGDNFNNYFKANGFGGYYKSIVVIFSSEKTQSKRQFNYNESFCGKNPCLLELDLGNGNILRVE